MSFESVAWALEQPIGGTQKILLLGIASHADKFGDNAWPSIETLMKYACVDARNVQRAIAALVAAGYLFRDVNEGGSRKTAHHMRPNLYRLNMAGKPVGMGTPPGASATPPPAPAPPEQSIEPSIEPSIKNTSAQARLSLVAAVVSKPDDVDDQVWMDFLTIRKAQRAPLTTTAVDGIRTQAGRAGLSLDAALRMCCERGWRGFKAAWIADKSGSAGGRIAEPFWRTEQRNRTLQAVPGIAEKPVEFFDVEAKNVTAIALG